MAVSLVQKLRPLSESSATRFTARITRNSGLSPEDRSHAALLVSDDVGQETLPAGYRAYLIRAPRENAPHDTYLLPRELAYLDEGDIVRVEPARRNFRVLFRASSPSNAFLVTERCDNYCIMCSQPPREIDDRWVVEELLELIPLLPVATPALGITGGEPGLLGPQLIQLIERLKLALPRTAIHVLTNGRAFAARPLSQALGGVEHPDLMLGVPLYSDIPEQHDYVVQARGAFDETVRGVLNLKQDKVRVEIRVVVHKETVERLPALARFIARNLAFIDHVALMGLELMGFARTNLDALWLDPLDYGDALREATETLHRARIPVSIYNHQLCVLPNSLHPFARRSISDWKNVYVRECDSCSAKNACGGFFTSSDLRRSRGIRALTVAGRST